MPVTSNFGLQDPSGAADAAAASTASPTIPRNFVHVFTRGDRLASLASLAGGAAAKSRAAGR